jgi:hypothetical protein
MPAVTDRRPLAIAAVIGALVFAAGIYLSRRPTPPTSAPQPAQQVAEPGGPPPAPPTSVTTEPSAPTEAPIAGPEVVANAPRKPRKTAPVSPSQPAQMPQPPPPVAKLAPAASSTTPTPSELAALYSRAGRELANLGKTDPARASDLWPRFRWIRLNDALTTPEKRAEAARLLESLLVMTRGRGSAAD